MRLAEEGGDQRQQQQHDQPRRIGGEPGGEADDGDDVLRLAEHLADERRAPADLPPGAVELVLDLAVLEVLEVERRGVLHQPDAGGIGEPFGQQRVHQGHHPAQNVRRHCEPQLRQDQQQEPQQQPAGEPAGGVGRMSRDLRDVHHLVDDQLAHVQRRDRQQRPDQP